MARQQQLAHAVGPTLLPLLASRFTYRPVLVALAVAVVVVALVAPRILGGNPHPIREAL